MRSRAVALVVYGVLAAVGGGALATTVLAGRGARLPARPQAAPRAEPSLAAPAGDGARDPEGAVAAAVAVVRSGQALLDAEPAGVEAIVAGYAARSTRDRQVAEAHRQLAALRTQLAGAAGPIRWRQAVLATKVAAFSPEAARVVVWHVGVLVAVGAAPPQSHWATSTLELVWQGGGWKLVSEEVERGPAPVASADAAPVSAEELEAALVGFEPVAAR